MPRRSAGGVRRGVGVGAAFAACGGAHRCGGALVRAATAAQDVDSALAWARRLSAWDPLDEVAARGLMLALAAAGDRAAALRSYDEFCRRLARELRLAPSAATREIASRFRRDARGTAAAAATACRCPNASMPLRAGVSRVGRRRPRDCTRSSHARAAASAASRWSPVRQVSARRACWLSSRAPRTGAGALVLYGRCEEEPATPYEPFVEALAPLSASGLLADGLGKCTTGRPGEPASDPEADRARMFDALAEWLDEVATRRPLVLALDDLHWAGSSDAGARAPPGDAAAARPAAPARLRARRRASPGHPLTEALAAIRRDRPVVRVALHGLDDAAVAAVVEELTGAPAGAGGRPRAARAHRGQPVLRPGDGAALRGRSRSRTPSATSSRRAPAGSRSARSDCSSSPRSPVRSSTSSSCSRLRVSPRSRCSTDSTTPCARASSRSCRRPSGSRSSTRSCETRLRGSCPQPGARTCTAGSPTRSPCGPRARPGDG